MINQVKDHVTAYIAQHTQLFDIESQEVIVSTQSNVITANGLIGEYTLSQGVSADGYSSACLNDTHEFDLNGQAVTSCFFGNEATEHTVLARKLNVGTAFKKEIANEIIQTDESGNLIIVYAGDTTNTRTGKKYSDSMDMSIKANRTIGVMFKVLAKQIDELGCTEYDKLFINSVVGASHEGTSLVVFESVVDRAYSGKFYAVDIMFSYTDAMFMNEAFLDRVKNFKATMGSPVI